MLPVGVQQMLSVRLNNHKNAKKDVQIGLKRCYAKTQKLAVAVCSAEMLSGWETPAILALIFVKEKQTNILFCFVF